MNAEVKTDVKVSVVVPVYNVEKYLAACLDSLLNQTLKEIEVICVDDASTDNSAQIMRDYAARDSRIKNIFFEQNSGVSHARNVAIEHIRGEYTFFADADDMLTLDAFSKLCAIADKNNVDQVLFLMDVIWECEHPILKKSYSQIYPQESVNQVFSGMTLFSRLLDKTLFTAPWSKITKSNLIKQHNVLFTEGHVHSDNFYTSKTLIFAERAVAVNERYYIRRVREDSITTATDSGATIRHICGFAAVIGELQIEISQGVYSLAQQKILNEFCALLTSSAMRRAQQLKVRERQLLYDKLAQCPWGTHWHFVMASLLRLHDKRKEEAQKQRNELKSFSYRLGRFLTWLPRKLRSGVRSIKKHGLSYTIKRLLRKA